MAGVEESTTNESNLFIVHFYKKNRLEFGVFNQIKCWQIKVTTVNLLQAIIIRNNFIELQFEMRNSRILHVDPISELIVKGVNSAESIQTNRSLIWLLFIPF